MREEEPTECYCDELNIPGVEEVHRLQKEKRAQSVGEQPRDNEYVRLLEPALREKYGDEDAMARQQINFLSVSAKNFEKV